MASTFVARAGKVEETFVERGQARVEIGDHALRSAILLGYARAEAVE